MIRSLTAMCPASRPHAWRCWAWRLISRAAHVLEESRKGTRVEAEAGALLAQDRDAGEDRVSHLGLPSNILELSL